MKKTLFLALLLVLTACPKRSVSEFPGIKTGSPQVSFASDGGVSVTNMVELCGVRITFNYLDQNIVARNDINQPVSLRVLPDSTFGIIGPTHEEVRSAPSGVIVARGFQKRVQVFLYAANGLPGKECYQTIILGQ